MRTNEPLMQTKEDWYIINGDEGYDYETVLEYAEQYCWGNLNTDEQRCMADCPVVEYFATTCMICRCE